jgi:DNA-binding MarR family transcriptional regulator
LPHNEAHSVFFCSAPAGADQDERVSLTTSLEPATAVEAAELAELFRQAMRRLQKGTRDTLRPLGLSGSQARVVRILADGPLRMSVIAIRLAVVPHSVTDVVDGAERAGVVARRPDPIDRRSTLVELTPLGRHLLDELDQARYESAARVFGPLTEEQRMQLLTVFRAILETDGNAR